MNKILREISRPLRRLSGAHTKPAPLPPAIAPAKVEHVDYLAPTVSLEEILPQSVNVDVCLMTRLIRKHVWAMPEHELIVLGAVVASLKPKLAFEFGTYTGGSTLTIAANAHPDFELTTVDIGPQPKSKIKYEPGSVYRTTRFASRITQLVEDSLQFQVGDRAGKMDFIFVDANHRYDWAKNDTELAFAMLRPGGVVLWHDYTWEPQHAECIGVTQVVNDMQRSLGRCFHIDGTRFAIYVP